MFYIEISSIVLSIIYDLLNKISSNDCRSNFLLDQEAKKERIHYNSQLYTKNINGLLTHHANLQLATRFYSREM